MPFQSVAQRAALLCSALLITVGCSFGYGDRRADSHDHAAHSDHADHSGHSHHPPATTASQDSATSKPTAHSIPQPRPVHPKERHLRNLRQLTFGGENAEAYFSASGDRLIFQSTRPPYSCDQIFTMTLDGTDVKLVSTGTGRTTCAFYYYPDDRRVLFSSTHEGDHVCPDTPDFSQGYVWPIYDSYEIYAANVDGTDLTNITNTSGYDAEATFAFDGSRILFTSMRDGDLDMYSMKPDGSDVVRLTDTPGYDGGGFYSYDNTKIVFRASRPKGEKLADYQRLLRENMIRPSALEIFVMDADGSNERQVTSNGKANFAPFLHPDGKRVIFSSNHHSESGREFDLFIGNIDGSGLEQVTHTAEFDGFPMFSRDGKTLVFCSNRHHDNPGDTNVFICDWVD